MSTTELYFEYIIIGVESLIWIVISFFIIIGESIIDFFKYCVSNLFSSFVLLAICYILGLVVDRISDQIFEKRKMEIRKKYNIKSGTSLDVWSKYNQDDFAKFTLSRIRVIRSTILNSLIIAITATYLVYKHYFSIPLVIFVFLLFMGISLCANFSHKHLLNNYYKKTSVLEKIVNNKEPIKKNK